MVTSSSKVLLNERDFIELITFEKNKFNALVKKFIEFNKTFESLANNIFTKDIQYSNNVSHWICKAYVKEAIEKIEIKTKEP